MFAPLLLFHLLCHIQISPHVVGKFFGWHWRLLEFSNLLHRTLHYLLIKLIQIYHRSLILIHETIKPFFYRIEIGIQVKCSKKDVITIFTF